MRRGRGGDAGRRGRRGCSTPAPPGAVDPAACGCARSASSTRRSTGRALTEEPWIQVDDPRVPFARAVRAGQLEPGAGAARAHRDRARVLLPGRRRRPGLGPRRRRPGRRVRRARWPTRSACSTTPPPRGALEVLRLPRRLSAAGRRPAAARPCAPGRWLDGLGGMHLAPGAAVIEAIEAGSAPRPGCGSPRGRARRGARSRRPGTRPLRSAGIAVSTAAERFRQLLGRPCDRPPAGAAPLRARRLDRPGRVRPGGAPGDDRRGRRLRAARARARPRRWSRAARAPACAAARRRSTTPRRLGRPDERASSRSTPTCPAPGSSPGCSTSTCRPPSRHLGCTTRPTRPPADVLDRRQRQHERRRPALPRVRRHRAHVLGMDIVLADGEVAAARRHRRPTPPGYDLRGVVVGSEGTLGVVTEVCVRLTPHPARRAHDAARLRHGRGCAARPSAASSPPACPGRHGDDGPAA